MNKNKSNEYRAIKRIEDKYGLLVFRCALQHLVLCGIQALMDREEVEKCKKEIHETTSPRSFMTADFQCGIIDCAVELASIEVWDLFRYIRTDVAIDGWTENREE